ncbi:hypothetical protein I656_00933 [Geobacillus sp. WSUCF1]|nr:hypothetical protein I656_00933 [Geobacillus sp. WSUCF1]
MNIYVAIGKTIQRLLYGGRVDRLQAAPSLLFVFLLLYMTEACERNYFDFYCIIKKETHLGLIRTYKALNDDSTKEG